MQLLKNIKKVYKKTIQIWPIQNLLLAIETSWNFSEAIETSQKPLEPDGSHWNIPEAI